MMAVKHTICSGELENWRAAAGGMISIATINKAPTTFMATATITARATVKAIRSRSGLIPAAQASSVFRVAIKRDDQRHQISNRTARTPPKRNNTKRAPMITPLLNLDKPA